MCIKILMQTLWVAVVSGEGVHAVESAGCGAVPSGAEVVLLCLLVVHFAGVEQGGIGIGG